MFETGAQTEARHAMENLPVEDRDWFIQPMSWESSTRTVLAGTPFKHSVVAVLPTAEIAERIVQDHNAVMVTTAEMPPVAVIEFARGRPGNENEMPRVISCNWQPDGQYPVYLAGNSPASDQSSTEDKTMADATEIPPLTFTYTNWRGETATRTVRPIGISYASTEWHPEPGWLLHAYDDEKKAGRDFAFSGFAAPQPAASDVPHDVVRALEAELQRFREERGYVVGWNDGHEHGVTETMATCIEIANEKVNEFGKPFSGPMAVGAHAVAAEIGAVLAARSSPPTAESVAVPALNRPSYCKPREFLLIASYCGDDNDACTDAQPCADCLRMCNIFGEDGRFKRTLGDYAPSSDTPAPSTSTEEALRAENARMHADREAVWQWIRTPDWEDEFDLVSWLNNRPCSLTVPLREETAERERRALSALSR